LPTILSGKMEAHFVIFYMYLLSEMHRARFAFIFSGLS
jgi:hypothetical protein